MCPSVCRSPVVLCMPPASDPRLFMAVRLIRSSRVPSPSRAADSAEQAPVPTDLRGTGPSARVPGPLAAPRD
ncbi:hypothetical protein H920_00992 [Fukomys damarensis]|uniref:Uncharacterized protein n=1 Tax=Fukomys damarensis TaxID=885580 RepID=A0A091E4W4_FUKDA|nr:hypothetical protein H920_00992 [Fukomys damarensis]